MREIKFRAWDTENKCWFPKDFRQEWLNICQNGEIVFGDCDGDPENGEGRFDIQQYTGLKDYKRTKEYPEGQEIYEGDIVHQFGGKNHLVEFKDCAFRCSGFPLNEFHSSEVIGNIYENPDLIKE